MSIVTDAVAGPFNLGLVVVRARIDVDPETSALTVTTDETGPYALPQIIDGVPLRLKRVTVDIDRPNFMFNPTNCAAQQITATISGRQDATAERVEPVRGGGLQEPRVQTEIRGLDQRADEPRRRREPRREALLPRRLGRQRGEHRDASRSNCPSSSPRA